jgi:hypothetical protein
MSVIQKDTGEIIRTAANPKIEYNGDVVKPISQETKNMMKSVCDKIIEKKYSYTTGRQYCYGGFWDGEYWD